jgi:hypothetical protein
MPGELEEQGGGVETGQLRDHRGAMLDRSAEMGQNVGLAAELRSPGKRIASRRGSSFFPSAPLSNAPFTFNCHGDIPLPP